jgi:hypothetical protein
MVNNSTNVNKTNNHHSPKKKLPQKTPPRMAFGIQVMALDIHRHVAGLS